MQEIEEKIVKRQDKCSNEPEQKRETNLKWDTQKERETAK